jgi:hypothetical protein
LFGIKEHFQKRSTFERQVFCRGKFFVEASFFCQGKNLRLISPEGKGRRLSLTFTAERMHRRNYRQGCQIFLDTI